VIEEFDPSSYDDTIIKLVIEENPVQVESAEGLVQWLDEMHGAWLEDRKTWLMTQLIGHSRLKNQTVLETIQELTDMASLEDEIMEAADEGGILCYPDGRLKGSTNA
jgi:hypothetical protein